MKKLVLGFIMGIIASAALFAVNAGILPESNRIQSVEFSSAREKRVVLTQVQPILDYMTEGGRERAEAGISEILNGSIPNSMPSPQPTRQPLQSEYPNISPGSWAWDIIPRLSEMTAGQIDESVHNFLDMQLFPGISQPENARVVLTQVQPILDYMTEGGRERAEVRISEILNQ